VNVEDAAVTGYDLDRGDRLLKLLEYLRRQTDGVRACPSGNAVLDPDQRSLSHLPILATDCSSVGQVAALPQAAAFAILSSSPSRLGSLESRGLIELHYPDGSVVAGPYEDYVSRRFLNRGDVFEASGMTWAMYDREDRLGVVVYLCRPA